MTSVPEVILEIPARPEYLSLTRQVVIAAVGLVETLGPERLADLGVAVSEATTNAVEAHAERGSDDRIVVRCDLDGDHIVVEVRDRGGGFDPTTAAQAPPADAADRLAWEHGLGLSLMQELTDEARIVPTAQGTEVRLVVYGRPSSVPVDDAEPGQP